MRPFEGKALWVGKCLICNGPLAFDAKTGEGASLEHIRAKSRGGGDESDNLALAHLRCNSQKGIAWDQKRRKKDEEYEMLISRLLECEAGAFGKRKKREGRRDRSPSLRSGSGQSGWWPWGRM